MHTNTNKNIAITQAINNSFKPPKQELPEYQQELEKSHDSEFHQNFNDGSDNGNVQSVFEGNSFHDLNRISIIPSRKITVQPKLKIGQPNDKYEQEADRVADQVMRMPQPAVNTSISTKPINIQRKCDACEQEEEEELRMKPLSLSISPLLQRKINSENVLSGNIESEFNSLEVGKPLTRNVRKYFEPRFGTDFSNVRIHDDNKAVNLSNKIGARAFTLGNDIYFNRGEFAPDRTEGKRLLGHELTHVVQQSANKYSNTLQRTPSSQELTEFDRQASEIRSHTSYSTLPGSSKRLIGQILSIARTRDNWRYYLTNLLLLLNTPNAPEENVTPETSSQEQQPSTTRSTREMNNEEVAQSLSSERSRLFYPEGRQAVNSEENQTTSPPRVWTIRRGRGGKLFRVDARDPGNIYVKIKVKLNGNNAEDISNVREMEDGIEKRVATFGYTLNLEFVNRNGNDVFNVGVDQTEWTNATNWSGGLNGLAHEMHHLLGLDDRYNYIDAHANNADMNMTDRIYWFRQQMNRSGTIRDEDSIMNDSTYGTMLTDDIAAVANISESSIIAAQQARRDLLTNVRRKAAHRVAVTYLKVNGTSPHFNRHEELQIVRGLIAPDIVNLEQIANILSRMHSILIGGTLTVGPEIDSCNTWSAYVVGNRVPIHLCNRYFNMSEEQQIRTLIHESAHAVGIGESEGETYFPIYDCTYSEDDNWMVADAWARYIHCNSGQDEDSGEAVSPD